MYVDDFRRYYVKLSIRSIATLTATVAVSMTVLFDRVSAFDGPFRPEPLLTLAFYFGIHALIPCGLVLTTASIAYDQNRCRYAAMRGAAYGLLILILLAIILDVILAVPV